MKSEEREAYSEWSRTRYDFHRRRRLI